MQYDPLDPKSYAFYQTFIAEDDARAPRYGSSDRKWPAVLGVLVMIGLLLAALAAGS